MHIRFTVHCNYCTNFKHTVYWNNIAEQHQIGEKICPNSTWCISRAPNTVTIPTCYITCSTINASECSHYEIVRATANVKWQHQLQRREPPARTDVVPFAVSTHADNPTGSGFTKRWPEPAEFSASVSFTISTKLWSNHPRGHHLSLMVKHRNIAAWVGISLSVPIRELNGRYRWPYKSATKRARFL